ncbi:hypothetical protein Agub_g11457 [Astrephomene gubernaculifera]|uniref:Uncharacterized protein n=1 Tax=Astrephomene gubernaculifera TaxID=47775 RepID=A0AAD3DWI5_9CHLO|nr:hypothetical protein Agub_g11457 [Astrephomene gubernaculifera]
MDGKQKATGSLPPEHDDIYAAVFNLVGQQRNETYEDLTKVLPSIKDKDPAELKELAARQALREMFKPSVDPLRVEYEQAAADEDVDDLSTEEGDWIGASVKTGAEDDEEVDEHGIPIVKLSRASSNFILDGPGDVKVDNFTPELEEEAGNANPDANSAPTVPQSAPKGDSSNPRVPGGAPTGSSSATSTSPSSSSTPAAAAATPAAAAATTYVPTLLARARRSTAGGEGATAAPTTTAAAAASTGRGSSAAAAPPAVVTLEDEIRALRALKHPNREAPGVGQAERCGREAAGAEDDDGDEDPEVILEPSSPRMSMLLPPAPLPVEGKSHATSAAAAAGVEADGSSSGDDDTLGRSSSDVDSSGGSGAVVRDGAGQVPEGPSCLPGQCQDSSSAASEEALWRALQGVDPRALLEHMGLAGGEGEEGEGEGDGEGEGEEGAADECVGGGGEDSCQAAQQQQQQPRLVQPGEEATQQQGRREQQQQDPTELAETPQVGTPAAAAAAEADAQGRPEAMAGGEGAGAAAGVGGGEGSSAGTAAGGSGDAAAVAGRPGEGAVSGGEGREGGAAGSGGEAGCGGVEVPAVAKTAPKTTEAAAAVAAVAAVAAGTDVQARTEAASQSEQQQQSQLVVVSSSRAGGSGGGGGSGGCRGGGGGGGTSDGPTYEEVEPFSLDPDFDYDNVVLTPREFPYSLLSTRWGAAGAPAGGPAAAAAAGQR